MPPASMSHPALPILPVRDDPNGFVVGRTFCIGRNYAEHAREMGHDPDREPPFFFMKPITAIFPIPEGAIAYLPYPAGTRDYHHEVELVAALGSGGADIALEKALSLVNAFAVGLDMTRRDLQGEAKKLGRPWEVGKGADLSGPVGPLSSVTAWPPDRLESATIRLSVNGSPRQEAPLSDMIWSLAEQIVHLSKLFTLRPGDLIFTGTPAGVASVARGDLLEAVVEGLAPIRLRVV